MFRIGCLAALLLLIGIPAIASRYVPWWGTLLIVLGEALVIVFVGPKLAGFAFKRFAMGLFMTKSRVLHGAMVDVHRVEAAERPPPRELTDDDDEDADDDTGDDPDGEDEPDEAADEGDEEDEEDEDEGPRDYVLVEFTLTPKPGQSKMQFYDPSELMLVPFDAKVTMDADEDPTALGGDTANVERVWLVDASGRETDDVDKITGPAHLRVIFACPPTLSGRRAKFRYYFEGFGDLLLPAPPPTGTIARSLS